ncbi:MAG: tetratricopeptide (TPR) repeat protein, partial [Porticoccaceae bacterium]
MSRFRKLTIVALTGCLLLSSAAGLQAQSDAETALKNAREAYQAERFDEARNFARAASQTDRKNPDVWLLLGKAHFQLGEVDQALASWRTLLKLAPNHEYAQRMVAAFEGRVTSVDARIRLAAVMIEQGQPKPARSELVVLRTRTSLSEKHLAKVLTLQAEVELLDGKAADALAALNELGIRNAAAASTLPVRILKARAQLAVGGESTSAGLAELQKIAVDAKDAPEGSVAELELLLYRLQHGADVVADVAAWIEKNGSVSAGRRARLALRDSVRRFLAASRPPVGPRPDAELNENDKSALAAAAFAAKAFVDPDDQVALAKTLTEHFEKKYLAIRGFSAAQNALKAIRALELPEAADVLIAASQKRVDVAEAHAEYDQINRDMGEAIVGPDTMAKWITENIGNPKELEARNAMIFGYLNVTRRAGPPDEDGELSAADLKALAAAAELVPKLKAANEVSTLVHGLG